MNDATEKRISQVETECVAHGESVPDEIAAIRQKLNNNEEITKEEHIQCFKFCMNMQNDVNDYY